MKRNKNLVLSIVVLVIITACFPAQVSSSPGTSPASIDRRLNESETAPSITEQDVPSPGKAITSQLPPIDNPSVEPTPTNIPSTDATVEKPQSSTSTPTQVYIPLVSTPLANSWSMAGANPERTSWSLEEINGNLNVKWFRPIEPNISPKVQVVANYDTLYVSTARGLYALNPDNGNVKWVYATEMPLGHSPTVTNQVAYVGGFDHYLHAINAVTGSSLWKFKAGSGFDTNPLVVNGKVYAGNRDGYFYALFASGPNAGQLAWRYKTQGPIHYSAAYKDGLIYFASDDHYAYALSAQNGQLVWKSAKLPGSGFHSWWPVVYDDYVIFSGSSSYRTGTDLGPGSLHDIDESEVYPNRMNEPKGTLVGPLGKAEGSWVKDTPTIDVSKSSGSTLPITEYFEKFPWRRTYFVLDKNTGQEYTTDFDNDGKPEYAPMLWFGAKGAGNRYPPIVGSDGILYQMNSYMSDPSIPGGQISGWQIGTPYISIVSSDWGAVDEPHAYSGGGDRIYWNLCCDRQSASFDISIPNSIFYDRYLAGNRPATGGPTSYRETGYFGYSLDENLPGYNVMYYGSDASSYASFGSKNGIYGYHGDQNPPIPYQGKLFMHRSNAILAFGPQSAVPAALPVAETVPVNDSLPGITVGQLQEQLVSEVQKILDTGHLRPGYINTGIFDVRSKSDCGDYLVDYWHNPGDIIYFLLRAYPHLPANIQQQTLTYLQNEYQQFKPFEYNHIGWQEGAFRESMLFPPEVLSAMAASSPQTKNNNFEGWGLNPLGFYSIWKYAQSVEPGNAKAIFDAAKSNLESPPPDSVLFEMPHVHNAFIGGYIGYLELQQMAGYSPDNVVQSELTRLLNLRVSEFSMDTSEQFFNSTIKAYCRTLNVSRNFMYLVPELAQYLRNSSALGKINAAVDEYEMLAPYWFVAKAESAFAEGVFTPLYDYHALFQAKAQILQESRTELSKYIDVPAMSVGDLFYIDNLVAAIEAGSP